MAKRYFDLTSAQVLQAVQAAALSKAGIDPATPGLSVHVRLVNIDDRRETVTTLGGAEVTIATSTQETAS